MEQAPGLEGYPCDTVLLFRYAIREPLPALVEFDIDLSSVGFSRNVT